MYPEIVPIDGPGMSRAVLGPADDMSAAVQVVCPAGLSAQGAEVEHDAAVIKEGWFVLHYELKISASELDVILLALSNWKTKDSIFNKQREELIDAYGKLQSIRTVKGLERYGIMDSSRLNWK